MAIKISSIRQQRLLSLKQSLFQLAVGAASMGFALWLFDADVDSLTNVVIVLLLITLLQSLLNPIFKLIAGMFGVLGIVAVSLTSSSLIVCLAIYILPGIVMQEPIDGLFVGWVYALGLTVAQWITVAQSDDVLLAEIIRKNNSPKTVAKTDKPGFVFIQLDGVSWPVLDWQLKAGNLPNIGRLIEDEDYAFLPWKTQLPSTTPASQAGILLGSNANIPAFRWYEKKSGKLVVANLPKDAALIEKRLSSGKGLLADGGVSIGNLFSGDAPTNIMVMSKLGGSKASLKSFSDYVSFFSSPLGFMRTIILSVGEMAKELYQARRAEARNINPRIKRHGSYILLRAITNVFLRNLQTTIVIQNMMKGVNSIYVDYLDYDEIAHHAGIARHESLAALTGLDQVVGLVCKAREYAPRNYEIILVSDHGQSQGATFKQLHSGKSLEEYVAEFTGSASVQASTNPSEEQTSSHFLIGLGTQTNRAGKAVALRVSKVLNKRDKSSGLNPEEKNNIVVTSSGNLGNIWLNEIKGRATYEKIEELYPDLITKLLGTEGIYIALVKTKLGSYRCMSANGSMDLAAGKIKGENPLQAYPGSWQDELLKLTSMSTAPDIAVISSYNPVTGEVHAFEELVGNHGGIGGWQTEAMVMHPKKLSIISEQMPEGTINGAETLHKIFKHWIAPAKNK